MPSLNPFSYIEKRSSNIEAKETPQLFPLKYRTSVTILGLIGISPSHLLSQHVIYMLTI